jgi:O-antigen/teichoic acid export membrane protein
VTTTDRQLPRGALYVSLGQGVFLLSGFFLHAFLARWLTPALYGVFGVAMTVLVWLEIIVNNGVPSALIKFLPDASFSERSIRQAAARSQAAISASLFLVMFLTAPLLANLLRDPALTGYLRLAFLDILAMGAYAYFRGMLNGWRVFRRLSLTIAFYSLVKLLAILLLVYLGFGVQGALIGNVIASLGGLAAGIYWTRRPKGGARAKPETPSREEDDQDARITMDERQLMAFVVPTVLLTLTSNVLLGLGLMGVKALAGDPDQVGYYSAAVKLAEAPRLVLLAFSFTLLPSLSYAIGAHDLPQSRRYLQQTIRLLALVLLPILAIVTSTAGPLVTFVYSDTYRSAAPILTVLIFAYAAYTVYITLVTALLAENRPWRALAIPLALLPVAVGGVWLGITRVGVMGAATATLVTVSCAALLVTGYVFSRFRPGISGRSLGRIALAAAVAWGLGCLLTIVTRSLPIPLGLLLFTGYLALVGIYLGLLLAFGEIRREDLVMVRTWLLPGRREEGT